MRLLAKAISGIALLATREAQADVPLLRFTLAAGIQAAALEVGAPAALPPPPHEPTYGTENPTQGTFQTWTLTSVRTVESIHLDLGDGRSLVVGAGFGTLSSHDSLGKFTRESGGEISLRLLTLTAECGLHRRLSPGDAVEILTGFDYPLYGKMQFGYSGVNSFGALTRARHEESIRSGWQVHLQGRYLFDLLPPLQIGIGIGGHFGRLTTPDRSDASAISGSMAELLANLTVE